MSEARQAELLEKARRHLVKNYRQQPIVLVRGEGVHVWDAAGVKYLDMHGGIAVSSLGHAHPRLGRAIAEQAARLIHTSNIYFNEPQVLLAERLAQLSFGDRVFFCNSGGEANEAAIKLARRWQVTVAQRPERVLMVATEGSFHGRTVATVSLTGQEKYRKNFGPMFEPVRFVPYGDLEAARAVLADGRACAFLIEPVQAEGGILVPPPGYLKGLRELCTETGTLLLFDEVQTGVGRTGTLFAYQQEDCEPDVMSLAKGLAGGVPIGAIVVKDHVGEGLAPLPGEPPPHASTFGGNPLACAAALTVLDVLEQDGLIESCRTLGEHLGRALDRLGAEYPTVTAGPGSARGRGLLRGLAVKTDVAGIVARCREKHVLLSSAGANVVRFAPPLVVTKAQLDEALAVLADVLAERARAA